MRAHRSSPKQVEIAQRRLRVARAYCQGRSVQEIAADEGVNHGTISRDLAAVRAEWREARHGLLDAHVAEELAKIDQLEAVAWEAWHCSREDLQTHKTRKVKGRTAVEIVVKDGVKERRAAPLPDLDSVELLRRGQVGNPTFLERVAWCIDRRCELLGLDPAKRILLPAAEGQSGELTDDERRGALLRIVAEMGVAELPEDLRAEVEQVGVPLLVGPGPAHDGRGEAPGPVAGETAARELDEGAAPLFPAVG